MRYRVPESVGQLVGIEGKVASGPRRVDQASGRNGPLVFQGWEAFLRLRWGRLHAFVREVGIGGPWPWTRKRLAQMTLCWGITTLAERGGLAGEQGVLESVLESILEIVLEVVVVLEAARFDASCHWCDGKAICGIRGRAEHGVEVSVHHGLSITRNLGRTVVVPLHRSGECGGAVERLRARELVGQAGEVSRVVVAVAGSVVAVREDGQIAF